MTEWGTSPWATTSHTPALSPAPPAFAKTSPSHGALGAGYFDTFADEAAWGDPTTPTPAGPSDGVGVTQNGTLGIQSPRPIATPGRIANEKGNRWIRPVGSIWQEEEGEEDGVDEENQDTTPALDATNVTADANGEDDEKGNRLESEAHEVSSRRKSFAEEDPWSGTGLGIDVDGARIHLAESEGQSELRERIVDDEDHESDRAVTPPQETQPDQDTKVIAPGANDDEVSSDEAAGRPVEIREAAMDDEIVHKSQPEDPTSPPRTPSVDFDIDVNALNDIFHSVSPTPALSDLSEYDSIITTSSGRKTHFRLTRPYSLRQYDLGEFEKYTRVTWQESAIHDKAVQIMTDWIAKDRASGGMFNVSSTKRRSLQSFGWGNEEKRDQHAPVVSASSILLPKISGPAGFGWSSSTMTPLKPTKVGDATSNDGTPRASAEIARMSPKPRRTPIRKARAASRQTFSSPLGQDTNGPDVLYDLDRLETARSSAQTPDKDPEGVKAAAKSKTTNQRSIITTDDDFGIFEDATDGGTAGFEDFAIAPPPAVILAPSTQHTPQDNLSDIASQPDNVSPRDLHEDNASHSSTTLQSPTQDVNTVTQNGRNSHQSNDDHDEFTTFKSALPSPMPPASPVKADEKEGLCNDDVEDDLDDFDAFESAPPAEYTDMSDEQYALGEAATNDVWSSKSSSDHRSSQTVGPIEPSRDAAGTETSKNGDRETAVNDTHRDKDRVAYDDFSMFETVVPKLATATQTNGTVDDDFAIFEKSFSPSQAPSDNMKKPPTPATISNGFIQSHVVPSESSRSATPQVDLRTSATAQDDAMPVQVATISAAEDDDDDFGAFEEASSPAVSGFPKPYASRNGTTLDTLTTSAPPSTLHASSLTTSSLIPPISAQPPPPDNAQKSRPTSVTSASKSPYSQPSQPPSLPPPSSTTSSAPLPPPQTSTKAKPQGTDRDRGNALLNMLTLLDASEDAANSHEDDFHDWDEGEGERLAGEREIGRLRRSEWVGERPVSVVNSSRLGNDDAGIGAGAVSWGTREGEAGRGRLDRDGDGDVDVVDQEAVGRIVGGLPDWGYMLR